MKSLFKYLAITSIIIVNSTSANAQFLKELGKAVENSVERTVTRKTEEKAEEKTSEAMDDVFDANKNRKKKKKEKAKTSSSQEYTFNFTATIEVETFEKKKTQKNTIIQSYGESNLLNSVEGNTMIMNFESEEVIILDQDSKTAQIMSMKWMKKMMGEGKSDNEESTATMTKTGKTKIINGYACYEYIIKDEDSETHAWFAPNVPFYYHEYLSGFSKTLNKDSPKFSLEQGYVMEMTSYDTDKNKTMHMIVTDLSKKEININLKDYSVTKLM